MKAGSVELTVQPCTRRRQKGDSGPWRWKWNNTDASLPLSVCPSVRMPVCLSMSCARIAHLIFPSTTETPGADGDERCGTWLES